MNPNLVRVAAAALTLSAAGFAFLTEREAFEPVARVPVAGDPPTNGFGSTRREDGSPVPLGEAITPQRAIKRALVHINKDIGVLRKCIKAPVAQGELDLLVDHSYQYGPTATCNSRVVSLTNEGRYGAACEAYLDWKLITPDRSKPKQKFDCSTLVNGKPNKVCWGVWERSKARRDKCAAVQAGG